MGERKITFATAIALGMSLCVLATPAAFAKTNTNAKDKTQKAYYVPNEIIVKVRPDVSSEFFAQKSFQGLTVKSELNLSFGKIFVLKKGDTGQSLQDTIKELESNDEVLYAEPNYIYSIDGFNDNADGPNDPRFSSLWGLKNTGSNEPSPNLVGEKGVAGADIDALRAWEISKGSKSVRIAVIDTGIDYNHPDLKDNVYTNLAELNGKTGVDDDNNGYVDDIHGYDFANKDGDALDDHGHGTHCAGTIGAVHNNGQGVAGVMDKVTLVPLKFLTAGGSGTTEGAIQAIDYATKMNVDVMSNSWGGGGYSKALEDSIKAASDKGIIFAAAAGNSSTNNDVGAHYPSNYALPNVISVAANTASDTLATFSSYGRRTVHVSAPGHRILSTVLNGGYAVYSGTSMATPHVSGVVGLLLAANNGRIPGEELRDRLIKTSVPVNSYRRKSVSNGRVNAYNFLTDTRPPRNEPNPTDWQAEKLTEAFESTHPYADSANVSKTYKFEGAKFIRVKVTRYDLETNYDFLRIKNGAGVETEALSGTGTNYVSDYIEGDTLRLDFTSDSSVNKWGYLVDSVEVIR